MYIQEELFNNSSPSVLGHNLINQPFIEQWPVVLVSPCLGSQSVLSLFCFVFCTVVSPSLFFLSMIHSHRSCALQITHDKLLIICCMNLNVGSLHILPARQCLTVCLLLSSHSTDLLCRAFLL